MKYLKKNNDDSVEIITLIPIKVIQLSDSSEMNVVGVRRTQTQCILYGSLGENGVGIVIGDQDFDIADLKENSFKDYMLVFPDIEKDILAKYSQASQDITVSVRQVEKNEIPTDRYFRGAWKDTGKIEIDMPRAREIHREKLRREREPLLADLDVQYMQADEKGNTALKKTITAQKQTLRDITNDPRIEAAKTPDEIKAVTLDGFK